MREPGTEARVSYALCEASYTILPFCRICDWPICGQPDFQATNACYNFQWFGLVLSPDIPVHHISVMWGMGHPCGEFGNETKLIGQHQLRGEKYTW